MKNPSGEDIGGDIVDYIVDWLDDKKEGWFESLEHTFSMERTKEENILKNIEEIDGSAFLSHLFKGNIYWNFIEILQQHF